MFENKNKAEIKDLKEFGLIQHIKSKIENKDKRVLQGIGDDASIIELKNNLVLVQSTDTLVENTHFDLTYSPIQHVGYKSIVANVSDIIAMNIRPDFVHISISFSSKFTLDAIDALYNGMLKACNKYKVEIVGGDTTTIAKGLVIGIGITGIGNKKSVVYRYGVKENDLLCVSGDLGGAYMGLQILEREKRIWAENPSIQPDFEGKDYILQRQLQPEARLDMIDLFEEINLKPSAMIDISDGLSSEIIHLSKANRIGFTIYEEKLPIDQVTYQQALDFNIGPATAALNGGEDYELLFTIDPKEYEKIKNLMDFSIIGHATGRDERCQMISKGGQSFELEAQGWNHMD